MMNKKLGIQLVNARRSKRYTFGAVNSVIQRVSSLVFNSVEAKEHAVRNRANGELFYGQRGALTHFSLQQTMCEPESDAGCALFPCGAVAVANSILAFIEQGDHVLVTSTTYEPSQNSYNKILSKLGAMTSRFDPLIDTDIVNYLQPNTKIVFLESPGSITMEVYDAPAIVVAVRSAAPGAAIMIDNTWAAGVLSKAPDFGTDVSIQAATKYLVGYSDTMIGTTVCNIHYWEQLRENIYLMGQAASADTAYVISRGLRTSGVRLRQHHESNLKMVEWSAEYPQVARVNRPALPGSKGHEFWKRDFIDSNGLFSLVLKKKPNDEELTSCLDNLSLSNMAYSQGEYRSLILANQPGHIAAVRPQGEIDFSGTLVHLYIDLEDIDDLITDLDAGFA